MKKLIKPKGGSKEGRAQFIAAGSIENLADTVDGAPISSASAPGETAELYGWCNNIRCIVPQSVRECQ